MHSLLRSSRASGSVPTVGNGPATLERTTAMACSVGRSPSKDGIGLHTDWSGPTSAWRCQNIYITGATTGSVSTQTIWKQQRRAITISYTPRCVLIASMATNSLMRTPTIARTVRRGNVESARLRHNGRSGRHLLMKNGKPLLNGAANADADPGTYDPYTHLAAAGVVGVIGSRV